MTPLLSVKNVSKVYSSHKALDNISLEIPQGSVYGLLGPNGAGKTSLIRIINQITGPDSGEILFNGQHLTPEHTNKIGYLPEERGLYKKMEVGEQALYLARLKGLSREEAIKRLRIWFDRFDIKPWWRKKIEELSKGMQQKVQFIVTVVHEPELLILDEPFTGFDPINANTIKDELLELNRKGTTIVLSTHRMESVEELCTHIALIHKSRKLLEGTVRSIRQSNRTLQYEIEYSVNSNPTHDLWNGIDILKSDSHDDHEVVRIKLPENVSPNEMLQRLLPSVSIHGFHEIIPSMNDIFISTVNGAGQTHE
jgi:ABC-2 type transport system ATP-binding protein